MRLIRYIPKGQWLMLYIGLPAFYILLFYIYGRIDVPYAWFQLHHLQILIQIGYFSLIYRFDFNNFMLISKCSDLREYYKKSCRLVITLAGIYQLPLCAVLAGCGWLVGDAADLQRAVIFIACTFCNSAVFGMAYVVLSFRLNTFTAKTGVCCILLLSYATVTGEGFFEMISILLLTMSTQLDWYFVIRFICVYGLLLGVLYLAADPRRKEW